MNKINYPLIASDFDGTLVDNKTVSSQNIEAINRYVDAGGIFVVVTGRMLCSIMAEVKKLGLKGLVAAYQGTVIADIESGAVVRSGGLSPQETEEICKVLEEVSAYINIYSQERLYVNIPSDNPQLMLYEDITGVKANTITDMPMSELVKKHSMTCQKVASLVAPKDRQKLFDYVNARLGDKYDVTCSAAVLVEISPKGDDKGTALAYIAKTHGIPMQKTVAVGDNLNDLSMIQAAGVGVAVGNAVDELKAQAQFISRPNTESAIAQVIEKFGFGN